MQKTQVFRRKKSEPLTGRAKKVSRFYSEIDFIDVDNKAKKFAKFIEDHFEEIVNILLEYESFEVVEDEVSRTLDLLQNLKENKDYFMFRICAVTSFLPRNQPLYALTCFVLVPSLMSDEVHFRVPHSMRHFFPRLLKLLNIEGNFPNVIVSKKERVEFLKERSALLVNSKTEESRPVTDAVIFTGTPHHADRLRLVFDQRTLFIANGAGHNPLVVSNDANITDAVEATLKLQLYNQGQDCAAPNSILIHKHSYEPYLRLLRAELKKIKIGHYRDRTCSVGPISDPEDLVRVQQLLVDNREWIDPLTSGVIRTADSLIEPCLICKPLNCGGNFVEVFAPLIFLQKYNEDSELENYFESPHYARNAMYITVFGSSKYVSSLINRSIDGKILHNENSVLFDRHLHMPGVERGTRPYGGNGYGASSLSIHGKITSKATLPQRDIFEHLIKPLLKDDQILKLRKLFVGMNKFVIKDVRKLMGLKITSSEEKKLSSGTHYIDALDIIASDKQRYIEFKPDRIFMLLPKINIEHAAVMQPKNVHRIRLLRKFLQKRNEINHNDFMTFLYSLAKKTGAPDPENKVEQLGLFKDIYQLLLGRETGPRLAQFLADADRKQVLELLNV